MTRGTRAFSQKKAGLVSFTIAVLLGAAQLGANCVDGVTPDCSNASECGPTMLDAAGEGSTVPMPEASTDATDASDAADAPSELEAGDAADGG